MSFVKVSILQVPFWQVVTTIIYDLHWDKIYVDKAKTTFRSKVKSKFTPQVPKSTNNNKGKKIVKPTFIFLIPSPIPAKLQKEVNELSKYFKKNTNSQQKKSYANATSSLKQPSPAAPKNITRETLKIKKMFSNLPNKKIEKMQKVINGSEDKAKLKINMTNKGPFRKQVIVPMNNDIAKKFIKNSSLYVANINHALKTIKSNTIANFIHIDSKGIVITTNNISSGSDLQEIEKYAKNSLPSDVENVSLPKLLQSKSYLKIIGILYISKKMNNQISLNDIENVLKNNHLFNDIVLTSKPYIIKVSPKSDMAIIWINISSFIATVRGTNMNPDVLQYKNCWKWSHMVGVCHIQGSKYVRCNGPHLTEQHHHFTWYCKANEKTNPLRLETKKGKPCPHTFKCLNCKGEHQADSYNCSFWKYHFHKKWHSKEYAKIWDN